MKRIVATIVLAASLVGIAAAPAEATSKGALLVALSALGDDFSAVQSAASAKSIPRLSIACEDMGIDAQVVASMSKPRGVPSSSWRHLMLAMDYYISAADDCVYGADNYDTDALQDSISSMTQGQRELTKARKSL